MQQMTETAQTHQQPPAPAGRPSRRDLQRSALRDLVRLATQCATTESEIEQQYQKTRDDAEKERETASRDLDLRFKALLDRLEQERQERLSKAEAKFEAELNAIDAADQTARQRIEHDFQSTQRDLRQQYEQATWLADSLFEGTETQLREDAKKAKETLEQQTASIDQMQEKARQVIRKYRQAVPEIAIAPTAPNSSTDSFEDQKHRAELHLQGLSSLGTPHLFRGVRPYLSVVAVLIAAFLAVHVLRTALGDLNKAILYGAGGVLLAFAILVIFLRVAAKSQVRRAYEPFAHAIASAHLAAQREHDEAARQRKQRHTDAVARREADVRLAREKFSPLLDKATRARDAALAAQQDDYQKRRPQIEQLAETFRAELQSWRQRKHDDLTQRYEREKNAIATRCQQRIDENDQLHGNSRSSLEQRLREGLHHIQAPMGDPAGNGHSPISWDSPAWASWRPSRQFTVQVPFGSLTVDLRKIADAVPRQGPLQLALPGAFSVPATLDFPKQASLLIQHDREGRELAIKTIQMVMTRLLTTLPPGRVRFTIIDPVGLGQNFAGFMHLADHDEALVGSRIWTERDQIAQRLADLTEHMETVIQKYLRNEFETIDDYNAQAGELAEPYRFLVIADLPVNFEEDSLRRLAAIASSGARCGIYTLIAHDTRQPLPPGTHVDELKASSVTLVTKTGMTNEAGGLSAHPSSLIPHPSASPHPSLHWQDDVFGQFPLAITPPPSEDFLTRVLDIVGRAAKEANRVEVSFDTIAPRPEQLWTASSTDELKVPVGRMGATRLQLLRLGKGVAQHALIAGKTGSGKSTLLHAMVTNLAMWYSPDEVEFYLIDFKKGVEFKTYATHQLPHARAIAVESDREFGLSVLQRLDAELIRRGNLYRDAGVQDLASYRQAARATSPSPSAPGEGSGIGDRPRPGRGEGLHPSSLIPHPSLPRTLLIIDEFQEFFSEDDKLAQDAAVLLDRLVRQGRAFGIHVLLGSQTIGGSSGLPRSTIGQMAIRIALQTSEADSHLILGDANSAARLLSRPGEAIYNDQGGLVEGNSPFQVAWLPDEKREQYLERVQSLFQSQISNLKSQPPPPVVFEGNAPANLSNNPHLLRLIDAPAYPPQVPAAHCFLGEPVAIKDPTSLLLRRQAGSNALIIGQQDESAMALIASSLISLAAQHAPRSAIFYILDGAPADSPLAGVFTQIAAALPHTVRNIDYRAVPEAISEIADEMKRRQSGDESGSPSIYLLIYGLQRYRALRKSEDSFSFGGGDDEKKPQPDKLFADILRDGPALGIHVIAWADTAATLERTLDRTAMREFDHRVLFQMSASDSSNLIDSPSANKLGQNRALAYSEEQGVMEKFRPYALPDENLLTHLRHRLSTKTTS